MDENQGLLELLKVIDPRALRVDRPKPDSFRTTNYRDRKWHGPLTEKETEDRKRNSEWKTPTGLQSADLDLFGLLSGIRNPLTTSLGSKLLSGGKIGKALAPLGAISEGMYGDKALAPVMDAVFDPNSEVRQAFLPYLAAKNPKLARQYVKTFGFDPTKPHILGRSQKEPDVALTTLGGRGGIHARRYRDMEQALKDSSYTGNSATGGQHRVIASTHIKNPYIWYNTDTQGEWLADLYKGTLKSRMGDDKLKQSHDIAIRLWQDPNLRNKFWTSAQQRRIKDRFDSPANHPFALSESLVRNKLSSQGYDAFLNTPGEYAQQLKVNPDWGNQRRLRDQVETAIDGILTERSRLASLDTHFVQGDPVTKARAIKDLQAARLQAENAITSLGLTGTDLEDLRKLAPTADNYPVLGAHLRNKLAPSQQNLLSSIFITDANKQNILQAFRTNAQDRNELASDLRRMRADLIKSGQSESARKAAYEAMKRIIERRKDNRYTTNSRLVNNASIRNKPAPNFEKWFEKNNYKPMYTGVDTTFERNPEAIFDTSGSNDVFLFSPPRPRNFDRSNLKYTGQDKPKTTLDQAMDLVLPQKKTPDRQIQPFVGGDMGKIEIPALDSITGSEYDGGYKSKTLPRRNADRITWEEMENEMFGNWSSLRPTTRQGYLSPFRPLPKNHQSRKSMATELRNVRQTIRDQRGEYTLEEIIKHLENRADSIKPQPKSGIFDDVVKDRLRTLFFSK